MILFSTRNSQATKLYKCNIMNLIKTRFSLLDSPHLTNEAFLNEQFTSAPDLINL